MRVFYLDILFQIFKKSETTLGTRNVWYWNISFNLPLFRFFSVLFIMTNFCFFIVQDSNRL